MIDTYQMPDGDSSRALGDTVLDADLVLSAT